MKWRALLLLLCVVILAGGAWLAWALADLPAPDDLSLRLQPPSVRILDRNGRLLYEVLPTEGGRHTSVTLEEIPLALRQATIATEDAHFYQNAGVDLAGMLRSLWINLRGGQTIAGGSTITQQVVRNLLMPPEERAQRTLRRKLREIVLAGQLTRQMSKDEILALYLNQVYYGGLTYGVEAAAQTYFDKPVSQLDLAESALLAGLPQAPALYNPFADLPAALERQRVVLGLMETAGFITAEQRTLAELEPLVLSTDPYPMEAPHFVLMVRAEIDRLFTPEEIRAAGGLQVQTTLNLDWQQQAVRAIQQQIERLRSIERQQVGHNLNNAALVAMDPHSGEILALVGSPDYADSAHSGAINMAISPRQPGSALKPLIYAAAFDPEQPGFWTSATAILDVTTNFITHEGRSYIPENYDGLEHGPVLAREALASSLNIPAVKALEHIGMARLFSFANSLGVTSLKDPRRADLSIALGGGEVRLLDLTAAYGAFASGGLRVYPQMIRQVADQTGKVLYQPSTPPQTRVMDARVAWLISDILNDDRARMLGFGANSVLRLERPAAVKTGTTTNFTDNWAVGYTPELVVGVWAGNTSHAGMRDITGLTGAAPIWHQFMRVALAGQPESDFARPAGLVQLEVCALSGKRVTTICPLRKTEWFIEGTQPQEQDDVYRVVELDAATARLANAATPAENRITELVLALPPEAARWARRQGLHLLSDVLPVSSDAQREPAASGGIRLVSPANGMIFQIAPGLPLDSQKIYLLAAAQPGISQVTFYVDDIAVAQSSAPVFEGWWALQPGEHTFLAEGKDANGNNLRSQKVTITVQK